MKCWKWWLVGAVILMALLAKIWFPHGGEELRQVFFGQGDASVVAVFGGDVWDESR